VNLCHSLAIRFSWKSDEISLIPILIKLIIPPRRSVNSPWTHAARTSSTTARISDAILSKMNQSSEPSRAAPDDSDPCGSMVRIKLAMFESLSRTTSMSPPPVSSLQGCGTSPQQTPFQISNLVKSRHDWLKQKSPIRSSCNEAKPGSYDGRECPINSEHRHDATNKRRSWISRKVKEERDPAETPKLTGSGQTHQSNPSRAEEQRDSGTSEYDTSRWRSIQCSRIRTTPELSASRCNANEETRLSHTQEVREPPVEEPMYEGQSVAYFIKHHRSLTRVTVVENTRKTPTPPGNSEDTLRPRFTGSLTGSPFRHSSLRSTTDKKVEDVDPRRLQLVKTLSSEDEWKLVRVDSGVCPRTHPVTSCAAICLDLRFCNIL